jgi:hypothetical protein
MLHSAARVYFQTRGTVVKTQFLVSHVRAVSYFSLFELDIILYFLFLFYNTYMMAEEKLLEAVREHSDFMTQNMVTT